MNTQKLKGSTAVILSFALASPHIVTAQTFENSSKNGISATIQLAQASINETEDAAKKDESKKPKKAKKNNKKNKKKQAEMKAEGEAKAEAKAEVKTETSQEEITADDTAAEDAKAKSDKKNKKKNNKNTKKQDKKAADTDQVKPVDQDQTATEAEATEAETVDTDKAQSGDDKNGRKKKGKKKKMEAVQSDTEASTEAANETPKVTATKDGKGAKGKKRKETITKKNRRASNQEKAEEVAVSNDDGGLNNLEKFLIGAAGIGVLAAVLHNRDKVVETDGDRVVVQRGDGDYYVLKDDNALLRQPGSTVETETFDDGSSRQIIVAADGTQIVTVRAPNGQVLSRTQYLTNGQTVQLFDDTVNEVPVRVADLPRVEQSSYASDTLSDADLRVALMATRNGDVDRSFSLQQIRQIRAVRELMPVIELSAITFPTGSAIIKADQAENLATVGKAIADLIAENPAEVFLVEGHTDAVGSATSNLSLSDRRAESVALALTEYFGVPAQNLVVQGYGESNLRIATDGPEQANRRAAVRRITPLLNPASEG